jgi:hypothetical protein
MPGRGDLVIADGVFGGHTRRVNASAPRRLPTPALEAYEAGPQELLRRAEALGIPWEQILREEVHAEDTLRRFLEDVDADWPLEAGLKILPSGFLRSWRVRDRLHGLWTRSRVAFDRKARRQLRGVVSRLLGKADDEGPSHAQHLWFAYQRVLLLQRVSRAAARSRGEKAERIAFICERARCRHDDAAWAVELEDAARRGHRLDAAVRKARDEGFPIPRATTEARAFAALREMVRVSPLLAKSKRPAGPRGVLSPSDRF